MRHTITPWAAVLLLAAAGTVHAAGYAVEDARQQPARAESRNTGAGAELVLSERRVSPRLVERLKRRLAEVAVPAGADPVVKVTRAEVVLFIEGAFAVPGVVSDSAYVRDAANRQWPDELTEIRQSGSSGRREYRVAIDLEVGGRTVSARGSEAFIGPENRARLDRAIAAAIDDAVKQLGG
jgi:hypothetical protein